MITISIPVPPSVNGAWCNVPGRGRVKSAAYRKWSADAGMLAKVQVAGKPQITGPLVVSIRCERPRAGADVDNRIKPVLDLLTDIRLIGDDSQVVKVSCEWAAVRGAIVDVSEVGEP